MYVFNVGRWSALWKTYESCLKEHTDPDTNVRLEAIATWFKMGRLQPLYVTSAFIQRGIQFRKHAQTVPGANGLSVWLNCPTAKSLFATLRLKPTTIWSKTQRPDPLSQTPSPNRSMSFCFWIWKCTTAEILVGITGVRELISTLKEKIYDRHPTKPGISFLDVLEPLILALVEVSSSMDAVIRSVSLRSRLRLGMIAKSPAR